MNSSHLNPIPPGSDQASFEATLHLIANAPIPPGLEERVNAALGAAPRHARVLEWPSSHGLEGRWAARPMGAGAWARAAAAAAIVAIVAGGGWSVYTHVQHQSSKVTVAPPLHQGPGAGFSNAGTIRKPQTVQGPVLVQPEKPKAAKKHARTASAQPPSATK